MRLESSISALLQQASSFVDTHPSCICTDLVLISQDLDRAELMECRQRAPLINERVMGSSSAAEMVPFPAPPKPANPLPQHISLSVTTSPMKPSLSSSGAAGGSPPAGLVSSTSAGMKKSGSQTSIAKKDSEGKDELMDSGLLRELMSKTMNAVEGAAREVKAAVQEGIYTIKDQRAAAYQELDDEGSGSGELRTAGCQPSQRDSSLHRPLHECGLFEDVPLTSARQAGSSFGGPQHTTSSGAAADKKSTGRHDITEDDDLL